MNKLIKRFASTLICALTIFGASLVLVHTSTWAQTNSNTALVVPVEEPIAGDYLNLANQYWVGVYCQEANPAAIQCTAQPVQLQTQHSMERSYDDDEPNTLSTTLRFTPAPPLFALSLSSFVNGQLKVGRLAPVIIGPYQRRNNVTFNGSQWQLRYPNYFPESNMDRVHLAKEPLSCFAGRLFDIQISNGTYQVTWQRALCDISTQGMVGDDDVIEPLWVGDIDGDNLPDVLLKLPSHPAAGVYTMLLSSQPKQTIQFEYSLPNNAGC